MANALCRASADLLHVITDDMPPDLIRHAVNPLTMRLVGRLDCGNAGPGIGAVDQHRDQGLAAALGKPPLKLGCWLDTRRHAHRISGVPSASGIATMRSEGG